MLELEKKNGAAGVWTITEDNHGLIGVAQSLKAAVKWLIETNWICEGNELWDPETRSYKSLSCFWGKDWINYLQELPNPKNALEELGFYCKWQEIIY